MVDFMATNQNGLSTKQRHMTELSQEVLLLSNVECPKLCTVEPAAEVHAKVCKAFGSSSMPPRSLPLFRTNDFALL